MKKQLLNKIIKGYEVKLIKDNDYIIFNNKGIKANEKNKKIEFLLNIDLIEKNLEKCLNQTFFNKKVVLKNYIETNNIITILFEEK